MAEQLKDTDDLRQPTRGDLVQVKDDLRREMKLWLGLGIAGGNVAAAFVTAYLKDPHAPASVVQAAASLFT